MVKFNMKKLPLLLALFTLLFSQNSHAADTVNVVTSIKPIHSFVAGVMEGVGVPKLIVSGANTPHGYSLKPSQARDLQNAQLVFWLGPNMETFLDKAIKNLGTDTRVSTLSKTTGLNLYEFREEEEDHDEHEEHEEHEEHQKHEEDHDEHEHHGLDLHVWLDPLNAKILVTEIAKQLSNVDPDRSNLYQKNASALLNRLDTLHLEVSKKLSSVQKKPYFVFHDAYQYFEKRYSLSPAGFLTSNPEIAPGAKHLSELQSHASELKVACIFSEPQFKTETFSRIMEGKSFKTAIIDPIGATLNEGPELYFSLISNMAKSIEGCLKP